MPLFIQKDIKTLMEQAKQRALSVLLPDGGTISMTPGSISRLLLAVVNMEFEEAYKKLEEIHLQAFLSTATGEFLDLIGALVNCKREDRTDEAFRYAISKRTTELETSNKLAVRMALLSVEGVQDVELKRFTHGTGSYTAFIITEDPVPSESILSRCREVLEDVTAYGNKYEVEGPNLLPVELGIKLIIKNTSTSVEALKESVKEKVRTYINSKKIGEELVVNEIIESVMKTSDDIYDMEFFEFKVNGKVVCIANQTCRYHERFIESSIPGAIKIY